MHAVILAAGFGEKLQPLTETTPPALLDVAGKPVIDYLLGFLSESPEIEDIHIRTNALYYPLFKDWLRECDYMGRVELSSNGISTPDGKMGAIGDLEDICSRKGFKEDLIVTAGDNIFDFPIIPFVEFCLGKEGDVIAVMETADESDMRDGGFVVVTSDDRIIDFERSPGEPKSSLLALPVYRLSSETIPFLKKYLMEDKGPDRIGSFFLWSYRRRPLFAHRIEGTRYHLRDVDSYESVRAAFEKKPGS